MSYLSLGFVTTMGLQSQSFVPHVFLFGPHRILLELRFAIQWTSQELQGRPVALYSGVLVLDVCDRPEALGAQGEILETEFAIQWTSREHQRNILALVP